MRVVGHSKEFNARVGALQNAIAATRKLELTALSGDALAAALEGIRARVREAEAA